jgi:hypothetical protein
VAGAECREFVDPNDSTRKALLLVDDDLSELDLFKYNILPESDYHGAGPNLFYMSIRENAQERLNNYF